MIKIGVIGCGKIAQFRHIPEYASNPNVRLVGFFDINQKRAADLATKFGGQAYESLEALLAADIDAVSVCTPNYVHAQQSIAALKAGKHVLCEKPMGVNEQECRWVVEAVQATGVHYTVGYNRGMAPLVVAARDLIGDSPAKRLIYHRIQAPFPASHWTHQAEIGGGRFVGEGCHIFDLLCELIPAPPVAVYAAGGTFLDPEMVQIPDSGIVTLTFADGSVGTTLIASDGCARFPKEATEIYWAGRAILIDDFTRLTYRDLAPEGDREIALPAQDKGHREELAAFARAIRGEGPPPNGLSQALRAALISFRVLDSLATGQPAAIAASDYTL